MPNPDWTERQLEFDFSGAHRPTDRPDKVENGFRTVDFKVEYPAETWLIECKDPEASIDSLRAGRIKDTITQMQTGVMLRQHFAPKLFGTYAFYALRDESLPAPVRYGIVIGTQIDAALRANVSDSVQRLIDLVGPIDRLSGDAPTVDVHDVYSWNEKFPSMTVKRVPSN